ncbi:MAG TPA: fumarylacetoacetate hydrolase family protein [Candidatus Baltobacteraceae bacterium]|nr:fumarylacetoacetate hydrolase family protein [Candidatus Baltobacteraceae bacterium]
MRLISFHASSGPRLGVVIGERAVAAADLKPGGPVTMAELLAGGDAALATLRRSAREVEADAASLDRLARPLGAFHLAAPVPRPGKIVAIGRNYADHAAEGGAALPPAPLIFAKWPSSVIGPGDEIRWDAALTSEVDYEGELAVVIGRSARRISAETARDHILGYTCLNDVSARNLQFGDRQWVRGKSLDTFCPMGPLLVTLDELPDPDDLAITCSVNGEQVQASRTSRMLFSVGRIIAHCSQAFTLEPGDVIATGTPAGVGVYRDPPRFLADGDVVRVAIEGIGELVNTCRVEHPAVSLP